MTHTARIRQLLESIARRALDRIGTAPDVRILQVVRTGPVITVATEQPGEYFAYGVDSFRLPTPDETDLDQVDPIDPSHWLLADQYGGHGLDEVDDMMAKAVTYADTLRSLYVTVPASGGAR